MLKKAGAILVLISLFFIFYYLKNRGSLNNRNSPDKKEISVILTGFGSRDLVGNWKGEISPFAEKLENRKDVSANLIMCQSAYEGYIHGTKVLAVVSGMAKVNTSACITDILHHYDSEVREVIVVGIAGITPVKGGVFDSSGKASESEDVMIGDICINSISFDFDLQHYTSDSQNTPLSKPEFWPQQSRFSSQLSVENSDLADELYKASLKVNYPAPSGNVKEVNTLYHKKSREPKVWKSDECLEATSDLYWHDINADLTAREIAAGLINDVKKVSILSSDVLIVTSMEALPAGVIVDRWNKTVKDDVAFAYVRGASNFNQPYLNANLLPALDGRKSLENLKSSNLTVFAIETASMPVLKMFELRALDD